MSTNGRACILDIPPTVGVLIFVVPSIRWPTSPGALGSDREISKEAG